MKKETLSNRESNNSPEAMALMSNIKGLTDQLISLCEELKSTDPRRASLAITNYEQASMWAVKAATTKTQ